MTYKQALTWLYGLEGRGIKLGLSNIKKLLNYFDNPHLKYPVILIGGTNGKGSVCAILTSILKEAGYKVHIDTLYKSARKKQASIKLSEQLEKVTEIDRAMWIWPNDNGFSPWDLYKNAS